MQPRNGMRKLRSRFINPLGSHFVYKVLLTLLTLRSTTGVNLLMGMRFD